MLSDFWEHNKDSLEDEEWPVGNVYVNHWRAPTKFIDVGDAEYVGGGEHLVNAIWDVAQEEFEAAWCLAESKWKEAILILEFELSSSILFL